MNLKQLIKFGMEESQEPVIKNPVLRQALEPRTMDLAEGGEVIGKPGGLVEPGVEYYAKWKTRAGNIISDKKTKKFQYPYTNQHGTFYRSEPKGVSKPTAAQIEIAEKTYGKRYPRKKGANLWNSLTDWERSNIVQKHTTGGYAGVPGGKLKKNMLSKDDFKRILKENKGKTYNEVVEILKPYKTKDGKKFTKSIIADRARSYNLSGTLIREEPKGRSEKSLLKRRKRQLKRYQDMMSTDEGRAKLKEYRIKTKALEYKKKGMDPPTINAEESLWKDIIKTAKENKGEGRFTLEGHKKSMSRGDFFSDTIKITDSVTEETFSYSSMKDFINKNAKSFNIENYSEAIKPHRQKWFINDQGLRNTMNEALIPNWTPNKRQTAITVQHNLGRQRNPLKASLAFWDANKNEHVIRTTFEKAWDKAKAAKKANPKFNLLKAQKKAFNVFKTDIEKLNIRSQPNMVKRMRNFGTELSLEDAVRLSKEKGATIPKGTYKEIETFKKQLLRLGDCGMYAGGRVGFKAGSRCINKALAKLKSGKLNASEKKIVDAMGDGLKKIGGKGGMPKGFWTTALKGEGYFALADFANNLTKGQSLDKSFSNAVHTASLGALNLGGNERDLMKYAEERGLNTREIKDWMDYAKTYGKYAKAYEDIDYAQETLMSDEIVGPDDELLQTSVLEQSPKRIQKLEDKLGEQYAAKGEAIERGYKDMNEAIEGVVAKEWNKTAGTALDRGLRKMVGMKGDEGLVWGGIGALTREAAEELGFGEHKSLKGFKPQTVLNYHPVYGYKEGIKSLIRQGDSPMEDMLYFMEKYYPDDRLLEEALRTKPEDLKEIEKWEDTGFGRKKRKVKVDMGTYDD